MTPPGRGIALIGPRGTGKTTVGRIVAQRLELPFVDADRMLETEAETSIARLFAEQGELFFRGLEEKILERIVSSKQPIVLATGGGVVLREANRNRLRQLGAVVWLTARVETLVERLRRDPSDRPALTASDPFVEIAEIAAGRMPLYAETADLVVDTDGLDPDQVARNVLERLETIPLPFQRNSVP